VVVLHPRVSVALETQHAAMPVDGATLPDDAHAILAMPRGPREQDGREPILEADEQLRGILDFVLVMSQAPGPCPHSLWLTAKVEQRVEQMRAVVEQDATAALALERPPRHLSAISLEPIDRKLGQVPCADRPVSHPLANLPPHGIEAVL